MEVRLLSFGIENRTGRGAARFSRPRGPEAFGWTVRRAGKP